MRWQWWQGRAFVAPKYNEQWCLCVCVCVCVSIWGGVVVQMG